MSLLAPAKLTTKANEGNSSLEGRADNLSRRNTLGIGWPKRANWVNELSSRLVEQQVDQCTSHARLTSDRERLSDERVTRTVGPRSGKRETTSRQRTPSRQQELQRLVGRQVLTGSTL